MARMQYDLRVLEKKHLKMKEADRADLDYDDLTVSEGEFSDEESKKFAAFLKEKREEIKRSNEVGDRIYDETYQNV